MNRSRRLIGVIVLGGAMLAGCSLSTERKAVTVPDSSVPFALLDPDSVPAPVATTLTGTTVPGRPVTIYLVKNDVLVPVIRAVPDPTPTALVVQLAADPTEAEIAAGLRSELATEGGPKLVLDSVLTRGVATVDLAPGFAALDSDSQLFAIAELVCTLTAQPGTGQVAFTLQNAPIEVPLPGGTTTGNPVTATDYGVLINP